MVGSRKIRMVKSKVPMNSYGERGRQRQRQREPCAGVPLPALTTAPPPVQRWGARRLSDATQDSPPQSWEGHLLSRSGETRAESRQRQDQLRGVQPIH